ncbi:hypothetical protein BDF20DRAFT_842762 [Mycotypha africana]|uniref:uncharacterized protein n=1 Tax=Mycotypha africana TaxID=64632 RepID=UPI002300E21C|nr:uncharacterized protein BDF20DRAFT_842762 [Mycotypha africana]KAI8991119.1 hypothetical protein BDF20DRAFT_842762 [Mycotypha africana]
MSFLKKLRLQPEKTTSLEDRPHYSHHSNNNNSLCTTQIESDSVIQDPTRQPPAEAETEDKSTTTTQDDKDIELGQQAQEEEQEKEKMSLLDNNIFCGFLLILAGFAIAFQAGCNATLNRYGGRSFSSVMSFSTGAVCCLIFFAFDIGLAKTPLPNDHVKTAPWYAWLGGILGAYYVVVNILTVPRLGTATVLSTFVSAQIIMACIIDHFGLVGVIQRTYTVWRILASLGLVGCVVVIALF